MRERPILMSGPMVRAILAGHKTQTRRVVKPQSEFQMRPAGGEFWLHHDRDIRRCPYGGPGDRLWLREKVTLIRGHGERADLHGPEEATLQYEADGATRRVTVPPEDRTFPWTRLTRPSIHMPRWACRLVLEIEAVRVERLHDISTEDAWAEGTWTKWPYENQPYKADNGSVYDVAWLTGEPSTVQERFRTSWDDLNAARGHGWDANPWVWAITFRRVSP